MSLLEHAKRELKLAGYDISDKGCEMHNDKEPFTGYVNSCARNAYDLLELMEKQGLSDASRNIVISLFDKLAQYKTLSPLTNNPDEWINVSSLSQVCWQSKRIPSCFTYNFITYHDVDADENYNIRTENGTEIRERKHKPMVEHPLKDYKK